MKYCYECGRMTAGNPLYCNFCGRSYDVKLCPRHHANSRIAEICSQCGSHDLSTPQPKVSVWWRIMEFLVRAFVGVMLACFSLLVLLEFLRTPEGQSMLICLGLLLLILWWLWSQLPDWFRKLVKRSFDRKKREER